MRLFIAIKVPEELHKHMQEVQGKIQKLRPRINYTKDFHITLQFLGELQPEDIEGIKERLGKIQFSPFKLTLKDLGYFPAQGMIRVLWIGLASLNHLIALQSAVVEATGIVPDKPFHPHITLGRVKFIKQLPGFKDYLKTIKVEKLKFTVDSFVLVKSMLSAEGPVYETIREYKAI